MSIYVLYDSRFGKSAQVAGALATALNGRDQVQLAPVQEAGSLSLQPEDVLLVGSPTQRQRPRPAVQEWLDGPGRCLEFCIDFGRMSS